MRQQQHLTLTTCYRLCSLRCFRAGPIIALYMSCSINSCCLLVENWCLLPPHGLRLVLTCHLHIESLFSVGWPPPVPCGVDVPWGVQGASLFCQIHSNGFLDGEANCCHGEPWAKALGYLCLMGWDKIGEIRAFCRKYSGKFRWNCLSQGWMDQNSLTSFVSSV